MATNVGIFNPNSQMKDYGRGEAAVNNHPFTTIEDFAEMVADRYDATLLAIRGGLTTKVWLAAEYELQLTLLAKFADDEEAER